MNESYPEDVVNRLAQEMMAMGLRSSSYLNDTMQYSCVGYMKADWWSCPYFMMEMNRYQWVLFFINEQRTYRMRWVILYKSTQFNLWNYARYIVEKSRIGESIIDFGRGVMIIK